MLKPMLNDSALLSKFFVLKTPTPRVRLSRAPTHCKTLRTLLQAPTARPNRPLLSWTVTPSVRRGLRI